MLKKIFPIILALFFLFNISALTENEANNFAINSYLLNPLDSETITSSTKIIYSQDYWVLETSNNQIIIVLDENNFVSDDTYKTILKTYLYFLNLEKYTTYELIDFYTTIPKATDSFNYTLDLTKIQLKQNWPNETQIITGLTNIQTRTKTVGELSLELAKELNDLDNYYELNQTNISKLETSSKNLESNTEKIIEQLGLLDSAIFELRMDLLDANISSEAKSNIGNSILVLPKELENIPKYNSEVKKIYLNLNSMKEYSENITTIENLLTNWVARKDKTIFLKPYFSKNDKIIKQQKLNNAKELFEYIIKDKSQWKNQEETNIFIVKYNEMITDYENKNYKSAARQVPTLVDFGLALIKQGYLDFNTNNYQYNQTIKEEESKFNIFWIIAIGLIIVLITVFVIDYIKKHKIKTEKKDDKEISVDF
jgi:hypothetical protein